MAIETEDFTGSGALSGDWTQMRNSVFRDEDRGRGSEAVQSNYAFWSGRSWSPDQYSQFEIVDYMGEFFQVLVRASGVFPNNNCYLVYGSSEDNATLSMIVDGTQDDLADLGAIVANGSVVRLEVEGDTLRFYDDDVQVGSDFQDETITSGSPGGFTYSNFILVDNWEGGELDGDDPDPDPDPDPEPDSGSEDRSDVFIWVDGIKAGFADCPPGSETGMQGVTGPVGPQGVAGNQGETGLEGPQGGTGLIGPQGQQGVTGLDGTSGETGAQGETGPQGSTGLQGPQGNDGDDGTDGISGPQGETGTQGQQGVTGLQGVGFSHVVQNGTLATWTGGTLVGSNVTNYGTTGISLAGNLSAGTFISSTNNQPGYQAVKNNTSSILSSRNASASNAPQFDLRHASEVVQIRNQRGGLEFYANNVFAASINPTGIFRIDNLGGVGVRSVFADPDGNLSATGIAQGQMGDTGIQGDTGVQGEQGVTGPESAGLHYIGDTGAHLGQTGTITYGLVGYNEVGLPTVPSAVKIVPGVTGPSLEFPVLSSTPTGLTKGSMWFQEGETGGAGATGLLLRAFDGSSIINIGQEAYYGSVLPDNPPPRVIFFWHTEDATLYSWNPVAEAWIDISSSVPGPAGETGSQGLKGDAGETGLVGATGETGLVGAQGNTGAVGPQGPQGIQGDPGPQGFTGVQGDQGETGGQGLTGLIGGQGQTGVKGDTGDTGVQGETGLIGPQGQTGLIGPQGVQGSQGVTGLQGLQGNQGDIGPQGFTGGQGQTGLIGPQGETGAQGIQGPQGIQGIQGIQGVTGFGITGPSVHVTGLSTSATGMVNFIFDGGGNYLTTGLKGDLRLPFDLSVQSYALWGAETGSMYVEIRRASLNDLGSIHTAPFLHAGETGPTLINEQVRERTNLMTAWPSATGIYGDILRVNINSVTGLRNATLSLQYARQLTIIEGPQGFTGVQGDQGETGGQGLTGLIGGQGQTGVKGDTGDTGVQGETGLIGPQGQTGLIGPQGVQGSQGVTGLQGLQGNQGDIGPQGFTGGQGQTGLIGPQGETGAQGIQGPQGIQGIQGIQGVTGFGITGPSVHVTGLSTSATGMVNFIFDGGGNYLTTGLKGDLRLPFDLSVQSYALWGAETGSMYVEIRRASLNDLGSIHTAPFLHAGETGPTLINEQVRERTNLMTAWPSATGIYGDILRVNINSVTGLRNATLSLQYARQLTIIEGPQGFTGVQGETGLSLPGPVGSTGLQGGQGQTGSQGQTGLGVTGLIGPQGIQGIQGPQGSQGPQGQTGAVGPQGTQGTQGNQGVTGVIGPQGAQGIQGQTGLRGLTGIVGPQGGQGVTGTPGFVGSGTAQRVALWTGTNTLGDSTIVKSGANYYINETGVSTSPNGLLNLIRGETGIALTVSAPFAGKGAAIGFGNNGGYGFIDYNQSSSQGIRMGSLGPLRLGRTSDAAYGASTFTERLTIGDTVALLAMREHIRTGSSGVTGISSNFDTLLLENSGSAGLTIATPDSSTSQITFANVADSDAATVRWSNTDNLFTIGTTRLAATELRFLAGNGSEVMRFSNSASTITAPAATWVLSGGGQTIFRKSTSDGSDSGAIGIYGGGDTAVNRGARVSVFGNEHASTGSVLIRTGNVSGGNFEVNTGNDVNRVQITQTGTINLFPADNLANGFVVAEGANNYLHVATTNSSEAMTFGNATTNPLFTFAGSGEVRITGGLLGLSGIPWINSSNSFTSHDSRAALQVSRNETTIISISAFGTAQTPLFAGRAARGTFSSQSAVQNNDPLFAIGGYGHDATSMTSTPKAYILARATETWTGGSTASAIGIETTPSGSATRSQVASFQNSLITLTPNTTVQRSHSGEGVLITSENTSNTASSRAIVRATVAGTSAGDAFFQALISGGQIYSFGLDNDDSDAFVLSSGGTLGTGNLFRIVSAEFAIDPNTIISRSASGGQVLLTVGNASNTASSTARILVQTAGTSADDAFMSFNRASANTWSIGLDASDANAFKISNGTTLGTNDKLTVTASSLSSPSPLTLSNSSSSAGTLLLTSTTAGNGITIGGDTNLYRSAANTLATDDDLDAKGFVHVGGRFCIASTSRVTAGNGGTSSGAPVDVNVSGRSRVVLTPTGDPGDRYYNFTNPVDGQVVYVSVTTDQHHIWLTNSIGPNVLNIEKMYNHSSSTSLCVCIYDGTLSRWSVNAGYHT